ncbi:MAG: hypothetical protein ACI89J_000132, partial [Hyphomicrobiaceae bacterium]
VQLHRSRVPLKLSALRQELFSRSSKAAAFESFRLKARRV